MLTFYLTYILTFYLEYLTYILTFFLAFCLTYVLAFYLAIFLAFYLTCVRVQSRSSTGSGAGGMEFGQRRADRSIRSSRHGVRVQACSAASGAGGEVRGFGSQGTARAEMRSRRRRSCTLVKIWRPSLAGVEKPNLSLFPLSA